MSRGSADLNLLSDGLVAEVDADYFNVDAIPDVWARPLLFEMALYQTSHPLHRKVLGEWRGLAALIALKEWRGFAISAERIVLEEHALPFTVAANRLAPSRSLFDDTGWTDLHVLLYMGQAIGMTSPTTILCTSVDYRASGVPWFVDRVLRDPLDPDYGGPFLNNDERQAVRVWLDRLVTNLRSHRQREGWERDADNQWEAFLGIVRALDRDLSRSFTQPQANLPDLPLSEDVLAMSTPNAYRYIDEVPAPPEASASTSPLRLVPSEGRGANATPLIVLDRTVAEQWNVPARDIRAWGTLSLDAAVPAGGMPPGDQRKVRNRTIAPAEWRRPDDFFLDSLRYYKSQSDQQDRAFVAAHVLEVPGEQTCGVSIILPLKPEVLTYLSPRDLAARVEIRAVGKAYDVILRLPLAGLDGQPRDFTVSKRYEGESLRTLEKLPVIGVWPDFQAPGWNDYFTYFERQPDAFYARPWTGYESDENRQERNDRGEIRREIGHISSYPEALECFDLRGETSIGLLLLQPPSTKPATGAKWKIGVDFGTTNSTVYYAAEGTPSPLTFQNRVRPITSERAASEYFHSRFFPNETITPPFRTFFRPRGQEYVHAESHAILDGHIVYLTDRAVSQKGYLQDVLTDLKWTQGPQDRILSRLFLEQVRIQAEAEAAAAGASTVEWAFSVPTSFSPRQREFARNVWRGLIDGDSRPIENTESIATAAYFLKSRKAPMAAGTVCVDVGGMSSDVAIWQNNQIQLQASLRLASRTVLIETINVLPALQHTLFDAARPLGQVAIETLLTRESSRLWEQVRAHDADPGMDLVRQSIVLGFGGVLFYVGLLLRHLAATGRYEPRLPSVYVGGNGARMLHWLADGRFEPTSQAVHAFEHVVKAATGFNEGHFRMEVTPDTHMKHEVAYGLVAPHSLNANVETTALAGEAFDVNGKNHDWYTELSDAMLAKGVAVPARLDKLREFVGAVNAYASGRNSIISPIDVSDRDLHIVAERVTQAVADQRGRDRRDIDPEPLFATALKELLGAVRDNVRSAEVAP